MFNKFQLTDDSFYYIRDKIFKISGIFFNDEKKDIFQLKLFKRFEVQKVDSVSQYLNLIDGYKGDIELIDLLNLLTTNETYFFRNLDRISLIVDELIPELHSKMNIEKSLKIWSAGCSTGEEPSTLRILLNEIQPDKNVEIIATDINQKVLNIAENGIYHKRSINNVPDHLKSKCFTLNDNKYKLTNNIINTISYNNHNIISDYPPIHNMFHIILCCNVMIYFNKESRQIALNTFKKHLINGGYLVLSHAEFNRDALKLFKMEELKGNVFYINN